MSTPLKERPDAPLGTLIFRAGLLPAETIENALEEGVKTGRRLGEILIERGLIKEEDLTRLLAGQKGLPFVSVRERTVDPEAARLFAEDQARLFNALPIGFEDGVPVIALADPTNEILNRNIREAIGQEARFVVAARSELNEMITEVFTEAEPAPAPLTVDTSIPPSEPSPEPEPAPEPAAAFEPELEPVAAADPEPEPVAAAEPEPAVAEPEPEVQFDASAYEPDPVPEPQPEPEPQVDPEPDPVAPAFEAPAAAPAAAVSDFEPAAEPVQPSADPYEPPVEPEPVMAPLATESVTQQTMQQSNGDVPHDFEDDSPPPTPAAGGAFRVSIRLTSGERMTVAECAELGEAKGYAKALTKQLGATDGEDWPFVNGRFLKPDTIVSVDVEAI
jgi:Type II secretion system (T2SS), protein E, N-terminal domain